MTKLSALALILTAALGVLILFLTLSETSGPVVAVSHIDKFYHVVAFAGLTFPIAITRPRWLWVAAPGFALFGGAIEIIQPSFGRGMEFLDWIADLVGIGIGGLLGIGLRKVLLRLRVKG